MYVSDDDKDESSTWSKPFICCSPSWSFKQNNIPILHPLTTRVGLAFIGRSFIHSSKEQSRLTIRSLNSREELLLLLSSYQCKWNLTLFGLHQPAKQCKCSNICTLLVQVKYSCTTSTYSLPIWHCHWLYFVLNLLNPITVLLNVLYSRTAFRFILFLSLLYYLREPYEHGTTSIRSSFHPSTYRLMMNRIPIEISGQRAFLP